MVVPIHRLTVITVLQTEAMGLEQILNQEESLNLVVEQMVQPTTEAHLLKTERTVPQLLNQEKLHSLQEQDNHKEAIATTALQIIEAAHLADHIVHLAEALLLQEEVAQVEEAVQEDLDKNTE